MPEPRSSRPVASPSGGASQTLQADQSRDSTAPVLTAGSAAEPGSAVNHSAAAAQPPDPGHRTSAGRHVSAEPQAISDSMNRGWLSDPGTRGTLLGVTSALAYTAANLQLRQVARPGDMDWAIWVSAWKAVPATALAVGLILWRSSRGLPALTPRRLILPLTITGLVMQLGGNVAFQWALSLGGLALTVPLIFATLIATGATLGRILLGEAVSGRSAIAMAVLIMAIGVLSSGAGEATRAMTSQQDSSSIVLAIFAACLAGASYGACGVMIRIAVRQQISVSATLLPLSLVGIVALGAISWVRMGTENLLATTSGELTIMLAAGVFNAVAFFAVSGALRYLSVNRANLINASQTSMCAVVGVVMFAEPVTGGLIAGTLLTIGGLMMMDREPPEPEPRAAPALE